MSLCFQKESADFPVHQPPFLAVRSNPSSFVVFAIVRLCVLEKQTCEATRLYLKSITSSSTDSESEEEDERNSDGSRVPKVRWIKKDMKDFLILFLKYSNFCNIKKVCSFILLLLFKMLKRSNCHFNFIYILYGCYDVYMKDWNMILPCANLYF